MAMPHAAGRRPSVLLTFSRRNRQDGRPIRVRQSEPERHAGPCGVRLGSRR